MLTTPLIAHDDNAGFGDCAVRSAGMLERHLVTSWRTESPGSHVEAAAFLPLDFGFGIGI